VAGAQPTSSGTHRGVNATASNSPSLCQDVVLGTERLHLSLCEVGMHLDLVHPNGHPCRSGDITTYGQGGFACCCDGARSDDGHAFHNTCTCKTCGAVTLVPPCTDPGAVVGWGASHKY
jgi:hypothetical protein